VRDRGFGRSLRNGFGVHIKTHMNQKVHNQSMCGYDFEADVHARKPDLLDKSLMPTGVRTLLDSIDYIIRTPKVLETLPSDTSPLNFFRFRCLLNRSKYRPGKPTSRITLVRTTQPFTGITHIAMQYFLGAGIHNTCTLNIQTKVGSA
jgi:hypothetical protein